jgi:hypothetical protein
MPETPEMRPEMRLRHSTSTLGRLEGRPPDINERRRAALEDIDNAKFSFVFTLSRLSTQLPEQNIVLIANVRILAVGTTSERAWLLVSASLLVHTTFSPSPSPQ